MMLDKKDLLNYFIENQPSFYGADNFMLSQSRKKYLDHFLDKGFSTKKIEAWHYTSIAHLKTSDLIPINYTATENLYSQNNNSSTYKIIIKDGKLQSANIGEGIKLLSLSELFTQKNDNIFADKILSMLNFLGDFNNQSEIALNNALCNDGIFIYIEENKTIDKLIEIEHIYNNNSNYGQNFILIGKNSIANITEQFSNANCAIFANHVTRIYLEENSHLNTFKLQNFSHDFTSLYYQQSQHNINARHDNFSLTLGAKIVKNEIRCYLNSPYAQANFSAIDLCHNIEHHDLYIATQHNSPNTLSSQNIRQILNDKSKAIFYGLVKISPDCPKSCARQLSKTILLSDTAQGFARPELDILTDDVICSHGSTIGNLDIQAIYYLQARGFSYSQAYTILINAFLNELINSISHNEAKIKVLNNLNMVDQS